MKELKRKAYERALEDLYEDLVSLQRWIITNGKRVALVFEGRDAAGKGGVIKAISAPLNSRYTRVVALPKPTERESSQWYFQRYVEHLPAAGELVLFDRSWYNRAGVEHVMGFCTPAQYRRFLEDCPAFERLVTDDGLILLKYWLAVDQEYPGAALRRARERSAQALQDLAGRPRGARRGIPGRPLRPAPSCAGDARRWPARPPPCGVGTPREPATARRAPAPRAPPPRRAGGPDGSG